MEEARALPWAAVWDRHCESRNVPPRERWLDDVRRYEHDVLARLVG